jgi:YbbR domain-containing protein
MKKKLLMGLLSLVLSFALWLYVITVVSPGSDDTFYDIPVIFTGESTLTERELIITDVLTEDVTLRLEGNRSDLVLLDRSNIEVIADLSRINMAGTHRLRFDVYYPGTVSDGAFKILNQEPSEVTVVVENRKSVAVPVVIDYQKTSVPEGFVADTENAKLDYSKINITGPESVIDQIAEARIYVTLTDMRESILGGKYPIYLCDKEGTPLSDVSLVVPNVTEVQLDVKIQQWEEIKLFVSVIDGGGATQKNSTIEILPKTIRLAGSEAALKKLAGGIEIAEINLGELMADTTQTVSLEGLLPEGVTNLSGTTEAKVKVSFPNLRTKELTVEEADIELINVPENMEVELTTKTLKIRVRGTVGQIANIIPSDLRVVIDFSNVPVGTSQVKAQVIIADKYTDVGELGSHSVYAEVRDTTND